MELLRIPRPLIERIDVSPDGISLTLRAALYMTTLVATRRNLSIRALYDRLIARGKSA